MSTVNEDEHLEAEHKDSAVLVKMVETERVSAPLASTFTYVLQGNEAPFQLLPRSEKRSRALISYATALGAAAGTASAYLCRRNAASNAQGVPTSALVLQATSNNMNSVVYEGASELWCVPQAGSVAMIISVLDEWYE